MFDFGIWSMFVYLLIVIIAIVVAPVSSIPLIPLASGIWGPIYTAILSIIGWTIGAVIAFVLARKYGVRIVGRIVDLKRIQKLEKLIPEKHLLILN